MRVRSMKTSGAKPGGLSVTTPVDSRCSRHVPRATTPDGDLPSVGGGARMRERLRQTLALHWGWLWRRARTWHGILGLITAKKEQDEERSQWTEARARFWAELREGQREAEAHCSRPHP